MPTPFRPADLRPEDWALHARALRRLAHELVGDPEQREELVQATWVAALEHPPRALSWSWLAAVLRNRARDLARRRARRGGAQELPVLASASPDAAEVAQRLELQEELSQALRALSEPYRSTLYLRYFEELSPSAIAARAGLPVKTVKTRLERGLAQLRERLAPRHGPDPRAFLLLLRPLSVAPALPPPIRIPGPTQVLIAGGLAVMWKKAALVVVLVLALALLWRTRSGAGERNRERAPVVALAATPPAEEATPALAPPPAPSEREASAVSAPPESARAASELGSLRVHVLWSDGTPASGVAVDLRRFATVPRFPEHGLTRVTTDERGWARASELPPGKVHVFALYGTDGTAEVAAGEERELELHIVEGLAVAGSVLDAHDAPVAGAEIWLTAGYMDWLGMAPVARSDATGRFALRDLPANQSLGAIAAGFAPTKLVDLELVDTRVHPAEVVLRLTEPGGALQGRVSDARGAAVPGAFVCVGVGEYGQMRADGTQAERWGPRAVQTDGEGRFRFDGLAAGVLPIAVRAKDAPTWSSTVEIQAGVTSELPVVLQASAVIAGVVRDARGAPVEHAFVRAFAQALAPNFIQMGQYDDPCVFGSPLALSDAEGRYRIQHVWPGEVHAYASPPRADDGFHSEFHAEEVLHASAGETLAWDPVLEPGRTIRGRALHSDRGPMAGVFVSAVEDGTRERRTLTADDDGRFEFFNLPAVPFRVDVQLNDAPRGSAPLFASGVVPGGAELELVADYPAPESNPSARVRGRFADPDGRFARPLTPTLETDQGTGYFPARSDADGFEFRGLAAGRYRLVGHDGEALGFVGEELELARGEELDLGTLEVRPGAALTVRLHRALGLEGVAIEGYMHMRELIQSTALDFTHEDELVFPNLTRGTYELRLYCGASAAQVYRALELSADTTLELPILSCALRKLELELAREAARGDLHLTIAGEDGTLWEDATYPRTWSDRSPFTAEFALPVGRFTVSAHTSTGLAASGELVVERAGDPAAPLHLALR